LIELDESIRKVLYYFAKKKKKLKMKFYKEDHPRTFQQGDLAYYEIKEMKIQESMASSTICGWVHTKLRMFLVKIISTLVTWMVINYYSHKLA